MKIKLLLPLFLTLLTSCSQPYQKGSLSIIPKPVSVMLGEGEFVINDRVKVYYSKDTLENYAFAVAKALQLEVGGLSQELPASSIYIEPLRNGRSEEYRIEVTPQNIRVKAHDYNGAYYASVTLSQLPKRLQTMKLEDYPRFHWRGMHLDCSRHFFNVDEVKRYIDLLAMHKLNRFHWHLTDDQGWRMESKKYPLLTQIAAWRADRTGESWSEREPLRKDEEATYGGFYTQEEIRDVVAYAKERGVMVIPEIEIPGHSSEVFAAYPELSCLGKRQDVTPGGYYPKDMATCYCAGNDSVFTFLEEIFDEVMELFPEAEYIHIGGDEVNTAFWEACPKCQQRIKEEKLKDCDELQSYFITKMVKYIASKGRNAIGWDEILKGGLTPEASVMSWRGISGGINAAKQGHKVVMTPNSHLYFDYYQNNPQVEPKSIGGLITLKKVYAYEPVPEKLSAQEAKYIMGVQANLWTEHIPVFSSVEYMALPRMSALAEVAWSEKESRDWDDFSARVKKQQERYREMGVNAHKGADFVDFELKFDSTRRVFAVKLSSERYGVAIRYTTDGTIPTINSTKYEKPFEVREVTKIIAVLHENGEIISKEPTERVIGVHKGIGKKIKYNSKPSSSYKTISDVPLFDGETGYIDHSDGMMQGVCAMDFDVEVDLLKKEPIHKVSLSCLQSVGKWIYFPTEVIFYQSDDAVTWNEISKETIDNSKEDYCVRKMFTANCGIETRYIRVVGKNGVTPDGLPGSGKINWIFVDELFIE